MKTRLILTVFITVMASFLYGSSDSDALALEKMKEPGVEYSADVVMETQNGVMNYKVYYALGGKQRQDMNYQGNQQIIILRQDKKVSWVLMPEQKMYMETSLGQPKENKEVQDISDCELDATPEGSESINGVTSTKSKISMSCPNNVGYEGYMWVSKEGIMVKMDAMVTYDGQKSRIKTELKNLKIAKQDPSLFEIPAGYRKLNMAGFGNMTPQGVDKEETSKPVKTDTGDAAKPLGSGDNTTQSTVQEKDKDTQTIEKVDKALDTVGKLKGLFGR
jgi:outer membrane lipoprotein-sorting protein